MPHPHRHPRPRLLRVVRVRARLALRRLDRIAPALMLVIPSWGTSVLLHAAGILLLALYLYARSGRHDEGEIQARIATQLTSDITSLVAADRPGDPFAKDKPETPPEAPSIAIEPLKNDLAAISQPVVPSLAHFAPDLAGPELPDESPPAGFKKGVGGKGSAKTGGGYKLHAEDVTAPFSGRDAMTRAQLVRREGGTNRSEKAVEDALDWIVRHQRDDGGWSLNFQGQCQQPGCPEQVAMESDTAATGLALLPLLGAGHIHTAKTRYQRQVRKGLDWLKDHQDPSGDLFVGGESRTAHLYSHAIATMALCEAFGLSQDPALGPHVQKAIEFIVHSQDMNGGGWRYQPGQAGDTSVFGWQMFALRSARLAGLRIPSKTVKGARYYLDAASGDRKALYSYMPGGPPSPVMTAEALLSRQYLGWPRDFPPLVKGAAHVAADLKTSTERNIYYWYYATQLLHNMQNDDWKQWNVKVREGLIEMQVQTAGCAHGSWDPARPQPDRWANAGGRLFLTALSTLTLEVYYRYLPLYRPSDTDPAEGERALPPRQPDSRPGAVPAAPAPGATALKESAPARMDRPR